MIRRNEGAEPGRDEPWRGASFDRTRARRLSSIACHYGWFPGGKP